jgi:hypothetical protein
MVCELPKTTRTLNHEGRMDEITVPAKQVYGTVSTIGNKTQYFGSYAVRVIK